MPDLVVEVKIKNSTQSGEQDVKRNLRGIGDEAEKTARKTKSLANIDFSALKQTLSQIADKVRSVGQAISGFGQRMTLAVSAPIVGLNILGLKFNALEEDTKTTFKVFLKDGEKANQLFKDLADFADKTPFRLDEVLGGGTTLLQSKIEDLKGVLKDAGDLAAANKTKGATIQDTSNVFSRLKAGDFGEAFERLRDFGISREMLEGEGLKFDKSGSYKGSVAEAMKAVRAIIQRDMGGLMEEQSKNFSGQISSLLDTLDRFLGEFTKPLFLQLKAGLNEALPYIVQLKDAFAALSPEAKKVISTVGLIIAAIAPALYIVGSLITFIGGVATGLSAIAGAIAAVGLAPILLSIAAVVIGVTVIFAEWAAIAVILYKAWQTNFGGIRDITLEVWATVKSSFTTAMNFIYSVVQSVGGQIVSWWRSNYPQIKQVVETVANGIKTTVGAFLEVVRGFWQRHGEAITKYVVTYLGYAKSVFTQIFSQIGKIVEIGLNLINGDWEKAWQSILQFIQNGSKLGITFFRGFIDTIGKLLAVLIPIAIENLGNFYNTVLNWIGRTIAATIYILATLPQQIISLVPKFIAAGASIASAIWQGIKDGLSNNNTISFDVPVAPNVVNSGSQNSAVGEMSLQKSQSLFNKLNTDADSQRQAREALAKAELSAQINIYQNQISEIEKMYKEGFSKISEIFKETNNPQQFESSFQQLKAWYGEQINTLVPEWENLVRQQTLADKKGSYERLEVYQDVQRRKLELENATNQLDIEAVKQLNDFKKQLSEDELRNFESLMNQRVELREARNASELKQIEQDLNLTFISESKAIERRNLLELDSLNFRKTQLNEYLSKVKGNSTKESEIAHQIALLDQQITQQKITNSQRVFDQKERERLKELEIQKIYTSVITDLDSQISDLNIKLGRSTELSKADAVAKMLQSEAYKNLTPEMREAIKTKAEEIDKLQQTAKAQQEYQNVFKKTADIFEDALTKLTEGNWKGFFDSILSEMKRFLLRAAAEWLASKFFKLISNQGQTGQSGGGLGSILGGIFGGGGSSGGIFTGNQGGAIWNFGSSGSPASGSNGNIIQQLIHASGQNQTAGSGSSRGIGGAGIAGLIGTGANIIGGLVGGRAGSAISGIGSGIAMGATIGSIIPGIGTLIGGAIGGIIGFFGGLFGSKEKKIDKKENMPKLQEGFKEAFEQLKQLAADKNAFYNDPDGTIEKAKSLRQQIASGFGIQFASKKYRNQAAQQITQKLAEADRMIADMQKTRDQVSTARVIDSELNANFATGVYMDKAFLKQYSQFKRRNGMLSGNFTGRDILPSYLAEGEMVLNPYQISNVIQNAGGEDVFRGAGIPGYATGTFVGGNNQQSVAPSATSSPSSGEKQPLVVKIYQANSGIVESDILDTVIEGFQEDYEVQTELVKAYDKTKSRTG